MNKITITACVLAAVAGAAQADIVTVTATGQVAWNGINSGQLGTVNGGEIATISFDVDSASYIDGNPGDTRSYAMVPGSFVLSFSGGAAVGSSDPTANFTIIDGWPVSDGFWVSNSEFSPGGIMLDEADYQFDLSLGYDGGTLGSLDIADAYGTYAYDGLTRFSMGVWRIFPDNVVMGIDFMEMTITPAPASMALLGLGGLAATRRRR